MDLEFYRCDTCKRMSERRILFRNQKCVCGNRRVRPTLLASWELWLFLICNPSYFVMAIWGEK